MPAASFHSLLPSFGGFFWAVFFVAYISNVMARIFKLIVSASVMRLKWRAATIEKGGKRQ